MIWSDLRKCNIDDIVGYINENLLKLGSLKKVADNLQVNESTIRKYLTSKGYKRIEMEFVPFDDTCNLRSNTQNKASNEDNHKAATTKNDRSITDVINMNDMKENLLYLNSEAETIKDMIQWFKNKDDSTITDVIELKEGIKIDLPEGNIKRTTIRINETVWNMFNDFVDANKPYEKHTLMAQALLEYIENHK